MEVLEINGRGTTIMGIFGRLIGVVFRAFFRIVFSAVLFAFIGAGAVLLVSFIVTHTWPPSTLTIATCVAIGILAAYSAGITVLVGEAISGIRSAERDVAKEVQTVESKV
jgi:hypothetical protein